MQAFYTRWHLFADWLLFEENGSTDEILQVEHAIELEEAADQLCAALDLDRRNDREHFLEAALYESIDPFYEGNVY